MLRGKTLGIDDSGGNTAGDRFRFILFLNGIFYPEIQKKSCLSIFYIEARNLHSAQNVDWPGKTYTDQRF
jgi:hypothetical protein